jgi:hypothetical protein
MGSRGPFSSEIARNNRYGKTKENIQMSEAIAWRDNWTEALEEAQKANRPLSLEFHLDG